jgi:hypothetical protein
MADEIMGGTLEHESLRDEAIKAIVNQLRHHPAIQHIIKPIVTMEYFKSAFNCMSDNTSLSHSIRGYHHYKAHP